MKLKTFIVVILATMALSLSAASAYQKKINEIYVKYYTLFKDGYSHELDLAESLIFVVDPEAMIAMAEMNALEWCSPNKLNQYIEQMKRELKQAESLMTAEDRKKKAEKDRKKTSVGYFEMAIRSKLLPWATKGEFEKTTDFENRIKEEGNSQFIKASYENFPRAVFQVSPQKYDADNEKYNIDIKYELQFPIESFTHNISVDIPMGIDDARLFNQNVPSIPIVVNAWGKDKQDIAPISYELTIYDKNIQ